MIRQCKKGVESKEGMSLIKQFFQKAPIRSPTETLPSRETSEGQLFEIDLFFRTLLVVSSISYCNKTLVHHRPL